MKNPISIRLIFNNVSMAIRMIYLLIGSLLSIFSFGQTKYLEVEKMHSTAKIYYLNNRVVQVRDLLLTNDSTLSFTNLDNYRKEDVNAKDIRFVSVKVGSKALEFGLLGTAIGVLSVALTHVDNPNSDVNFGPLYIGFGLGGAVIGSFIGAISPVWETRYISMRQNKNTLGIYPSVLHGKPALQMVLRL